MKPVDVAREAVLAEVRIRSHVRETYLEPSPWLSTEGRADVHCKLENLQHTGSFKLRGAMNKLLSLSDEELGRGVITASSGNHGMAFAHGLGALGRQGIVFVPEVVSTVKADAIGRLGAELRRHGRDTVETEIFARRYAEENGMIFVPPYNDAQVVAGQGTIGVELARQLERIDAVFASVGGGGLISGIAGYLKSIRPDVRIVGCWPENSAVMMKSMQAGRILDLPSLPTLSDGTAGAIEPGAITFELCRALVDECVSVTEDEIAESLRLFVETHHMLIEGAAAVAVAAYRKTCGRWAGRKVVLVICGANIASETLADVLSGPRGDRARG